MSRKDYIAIAKIIKESGGLDHAFCHDKRHVAGIAKEMAFYFKSQNSRFDSQRFLDACGVGA